MSQIGVMVCGHGSRDEEAVREFASVAQGIRERLPRYPVESGFLEFATPIIRDGLDKLRAAGCARVLAVPGMLFAAGHAKNDIPSVLSTYEAQHPGMTIDYGRELAIDAKLINAAADRIRAALVGEDGTELHVEETEVHRPENPEWFGNSIGKSRVVCDPFQPLKQKDSHSITVTNGNSGLETPFGTPLAYMLREMETERTERQTRRRDVGSVRDDSCGHR